MGLLGSIKGAIQRCRSLARQQAATVAATRSPKLTCVPAVAGIVRHLRLEVLPEAQALVLDPRPEEEGVHTGHEVSKRLVVNGARRDLQGE